MGDPSEATQGFSSGHLDEAAAFRAYGEMSGLLVGFVVAALTVVFTLVPDVDPELLGRVVIFLSLGLLSGAAAALVFSTLGAFPSLREHERVGHLLTPAPAVCAVAVLSGFETLAVILVPSVAGFLVLTTACLACLVVVPAYVGLPWEPRHRMIGLVLAWTAILLVMIEREFFQWWDVLGWLSTLVMVIAVLVAASAALAYLRVSRPHAAHVLRLSHAREQVLTAAILTLVVVVMVAALLPPP